MTERVVRVLLIDDHPLVRTAVAQALARASMEVVGEASSAADGLEQALAMRPDVVILDIDMPAGLGLAIVPELVARLPDTRVVMLTVSTVHGHVTRALEAGAAGYLTKDMSPDALVRAVRSVAAGDMAMSRPAATSLARSAGARPEADDPTMGLTPRELEILELLSHGLTDRAIGIQLGISPRTVETHVSNITEKLRVTSRAGAVVALRARRTP